MGGGSGAWALTRWGAQDVPLTEAKWRCRDCHLQTPPKYSAYNDAEVPFCRECGKHVSACGKAHWVRFEQLPPARQSEMEAKYAPPFIRTLQVRWPSVKALPGQPVPSMY